jgi:DNA-binding MarR family transcriptional regulator
MADRDSTELLVRELYELGAIKRDMARRAFSAPAIAGLAALAAVHRLGRPRIGDIADTLHVDLSVASRQVTALATAGHVRRERDPHDRRSQLIEITETGRAALHDAHQKMVDAFADAVAGWGADDVRALAASLARLREDYAHAELKEAA